MVNYLNALKYPFTNVKSIIIGAVMSFLWFLLIPFFFLNGYIVRVIRSTNESSEFMPEWDNWKEMLFDGFMVFAVQVTYVLPAMIIYAIASLTTPVSLVSAFAASEIMGIGIVAIVLMTLSSVALLLAFLIMPVAVINYALTRDFKKAFNLKGIVRSIMLNPLNYMLNIIIGFFVFSLFMLTSPFLYLVIGALLVYPTLFYHRILAEWFTELP
jgi:hypothetical protein